MTYLVITEGRNKLTLFLVDRKKTKKQWWTYDLALAMQFYKESAAKIQANKLMYKNPQVVNFDEAKNMESENNYIVAILEEHPFSSEALGQE